MATGALVERVRTSDLTLVVAAQLLDGAGAVAGAENAGMRGNANDSCAGKAGELVVLELLANHPRQQVAVWELAGSQGCLGALSRYRALERDLDDGKNIWELVLHGDA